MSACCTAQLCRQKKCYNALITLGLVVCLVQDNLASSVAGVTEADYRMDTKMELITCSIEGEGEDPP